MELNNLYKNDWMKNFYANNDMRFMIRETYIVLNGQIQLSANEMLGRGQIKAARQQRIMNRKSYALMLQSAIAQAVK